MTSVTHVKSGSAEPRPTRRERARATRRRIAQAALTAFSANGYAATTMDAVARDAGVAVQTVYFTFHTKAELLVAAIELAGGAPDDPAVVMERAWIGQVIAAPDGPKRLSLIVEHGNRIYGRVGPLLPAVSAAASIDPDVDRAWKGLGARRRDGMARIIDVFADRGELRSGLDRAVALDILFGIHRAETYLAFVEGCGWSVDRYKAWQFVTLARQLLGMNGSSAVAASRGVVGGPFAFEVEVPTLD
jgi:AcrR family transcriptional regulator